MEKMANIGLISETFDNAFGKLPEWMQVTVMTVFSILFDA
jgi:hypothetical protein